jgi:hypothetical protein
MNVINCETCRWVGCRNYGHDRPACIKYIPELTATSKPPQPARITEYDSGKNRCQEITDELNRQRAIVSNQVDYRN